MGIGTARVGEPVVTPDLGMCDSAPGELRVLAGGGVRHARMWVLPVSAGVLRVPARLSLSGCIFCISPTVSPGQISPGNLRFAHIVPLLYHLLQQVFVFQRAVISILTLKVI